ncbi:chemotaxis protein CheD [Duganella aceris]|jgi:chemotaxis protein CheD|uniref:Chemotaxis protein CheD n=1 Tax=Duganella aceris TaxID=2703883 RepID=A0ABX0FK58_9BURK|nr:chemotaxis protein CheD [Duganella aceris]NGZ84902.1 chemotaxis protein CheD [Duganella aceris]
MQTTTINASNNAAATVNHWAAFDFGGAEERTVVSTRSVQVGIGQLKIGGRTDQLQALLGSCVGIAFIWKKRGRCGLAHCLLPEAPEAQAELSARYVSQAVPALLLLIGATEADYPDIQVVLAGGATMLNARSSRLQIGQQNADAAKRHLRKSGLNVQYCRIGGKCGRTLTVDCATSSFIVNEIVTAQPNAAYANA